MNAVMALPRHWPTMFLVVASSGLPIRRRIAYLGLSPIPG